MVKKNKSVKNKEGDIKQQIIDDYLRVKKNYIKQFPDENDLPRDYYRANSKFKEFDEVFGTYGNLKNCADIDSTTYNRNDFDIVKDKYKSNIGKKFFVSAIIAGSKVDEKFFESIKSYCKYNKAELVLLVMRGIHNDDSFTEEDVQKYGSYFVTDFRFNENLEAKDLKINPQQRKPLTGLKSISKNKNSLILASPKQQAEIIPSSNSNLPHLNHSTGCINNIKYCDTRVGRIADKDHVIGGLIVEVHNNKLFSLRQVQKNPDNSFYDLNKKYSQNKIENITVKAFVMGDLHCGSQNPNIMKSWDECIDLLKPSYVIIHDLFDGRSINHHHENDFQYKVNLPNQIDTLEKELNMVGETLEDMQDKYKNSTLVIVRSNHDLWLDDYLKTAKYARMEEYRNHKFSLELAKYVLEEKNPICEYVKSKFKVKKAKWLNLDEDLILAGCQCGSHGHLGSNGSRNTSIQSMESQYGDCITGHTHTFRILHKAWSVGTSTYLKMGYNVGTSSWINSSVVLYDTGARQSIISLNGIWRLK